jgi:hypothetical protein
MSFEPNSLQTFSAIVIAVYYVHSFYIIRADVIVKKTLKSIEPYTSNPKKNSRFCIGCGEPATKLVKYSTEEAIILEKHCDKCAKAIEDSSPK